MNILFISSIQMWGGGELWLMDIMGGLKERGHNVSLICRPNTELAANALARGFDVITLRVGGDFDPLVIWRARRIMREKNIDVICTNMDKDLRFGGIAAKLAGVPGIVPSREIDYPLKNTLRYRFFYNRIATKIVVNSGATLQTVLRNAPWLNPERVKVIHKGIDVTPYDTPSSKTFRDEFHISPKASVVAFVGQLDERKGIHYLLEAWTIIHTKHPQAVLLMVGKGKMQNEIEEFIRENSLTKTILLAGFRQDVPAILQQSLMLVLPSLWEGFGYVLIEAMAARIPTVATRTSSIPEIVADEKSGILVEPRDPDSLAKAIAKLLSNPSKAKKMGLYGRKIVEEKFTIKKMIDEFEKVFREEAGVSAALTEKQGNPSRVIS